MSNTLNEQVLLEVSKKHWKSCGEQCDYNDVKNGECECYNREMDEHEEQSPC